MQYRRFGRLDWRPSALGFGCMRLPVQGDDRSRIDEAQASEMVAYAIDHGVTYLDSAYVYHGGESERFLGRVLKGGYRERVRVATKLPMGMVESRADADRILDEQLQRLQTDRIDFYLFHGLRRPRWETVQRLGLLDWAESARAAGKIRYLGFSFHDSFEVLKTIIDSNPGWDFCQIQYNYMDTEIQAGTKGLQYAASRGLGVVVMEPILGGRLADPPPAVREIWDSAPVQRTPPDWALQWVWSQPEVSVVLSGMSTLRHVVENVASAGMSGPGTLTAADLAVIARARAKYEELCPIPCTRCEYCLPCTVGLNIPRLFETLNRGVMYGKLEEARQRYHRMAEQERASACIQCRECEAKCPQSIPISEWMPLVEEILGQGMDVDARLAQMK